jgi:hypothetical protein
MIWVTVTLSLDVPYIVVVPRWVRSLIGVCIQKRCPTSKRNRIHMNQSQFNNHSIISFHSQLFI